MNINLPQEVQYIIAGLEENGYEAYIVGGCVRDSLLGKEPHDWDICTSALPEETMSCFNRNHIIKTGLRHGTITLMLNHNPFEITTYRIDGIYTDNRHPDKVVFVNNLKEDLTRRDFTINAMAYHPQDGIVDYFNGVNDLNAGIIKCVGNADMRFQEDALRIMRALRFACVLDFSINDKTSKAMHDNRKLLSNIAVERIAGELNKLIVGNNISDIFLHHLSVITEIIPELIPAIGFEQNNPHHCFDVLHHILSSVDYAPKDVMVRLAMLFHDIGKPGCYTESDGTGHFYGHSQISSDMAKSILLRLKYDHNTINAVTNLILYHDADIQPRRKHIKRWLNKVGEKGIRHLIDIKKADAMAQAEQYRKNKLVDLNKILVLVDEIIEQRQCFSLKDLTVNGRDLISIGVPEGVQIGLVLNRLMDMVIDEDAVNDRDELLRIAQQLNRK